MYEVPALGSDTAEFPLVSNKEKGAALTARIHAISGMTIEALADEAKMTREWVGQMLKHGKGAEKAWDRLEAAMSRIEREHGHDAVTTYATTEGQVTIVAEGVFGVAKLTVSGSPEGAEKAMARLIEDIRKGDADPQK